MKDDPDTRTLEFGYEFEVDIYPYLFFLNQADGVEPTEEESKSSFLFIWLGSKMVRNISLIRATPPRIDCTADADDTIECVVMSYPPVPANNFSWLLPDADRFMPGVYPTNGSGPSLIVHRYNKSKEIHRSSTLSPLLMPPATPPPPIPTPLLPPTKEVLSDSAWMVKGGARTRKSVVVDDRWHQSVVTLKVRWLDRTLTQAISLRSVAFPEHPVTKTENPIYHPTHSYGLEWLLANAGLLLMLAGLLTLVVFLFALLVFLRRRGVIFCPGNRKLVIRDPLRNGVGTFGGAASASASCHEIGFLASGGYKTVDTRDIYNLERTASGAVWPIPETHLDGGVSGGVANGVKNGRSVSSYDMGPGNYASMIPRLHSLPVQLGWHAEQAAMSSAEDPLLLQDWSSHGYAKLANALRMKDTNRDGYLNIEEVDAVLDSYNTVYHLGLSNGQRREALKQTSTEDETNIDALVLMLQQRSLEAKQKNGK